MSISPQRVLVTGSADGLGLAALHDLVSRGYDVIGHARNQERADALHAMVPGVERVIVADAASFEQIRAMAEQLASLGPLDAVIHNVGVGYREPRRVLTQDGHAHVLQVNVLSPYLLTALLPHPKRMIWTTSALHLDGNPSLRDIDWEERRWNGLQAYNDSKLFDATLGMAIARRWPDTYSNIVGPGWVATRMGGPGAPDNLSIGHTTQVWLAEARDPHAQVTGKYFYHQEPMSPHPASKDRAFQEKLIDRCRTLTGVEL